MSNVPSNICLLAILKSVLNVLMLKLLLPTCQRSVRLQQITLISYNIKTTCLLTVQLPSCQQNSSGLLRPLKVSSGI